MSIIIRLQNLPWSANALDIRQFFSGLQIPEGGVHIVGGELGDAFIAFSTDEDARQAFLRTDGQIKGIQVKLMLSSRTEMQRVIEQARTQSMAAFMLPAAPPSIQPVAIPAAPLPAAVPQVVQPAAVPDFQKDRDNKEQDYTDRRRDGRRRSRSKSRARDSRDKSRRRYRDRSRTRSKSRDRRDRRSRRERSRSRNRSKDRESRRVRDRAKSTVKDLDTARKVPDIWESRPPPALNIIPPTAVIGNDSPGILGPSPWNLPPHAAAANIVAANLQARGLNAFSTPLHVPPPPANPAVPSRGRDSWPPGNQQVPREREPFKRTPDFSANNPVITSTTNRGLPDFKNRQVGKIRDESLPDTRTMRKELYGSKIIDRKPDDVQKPNKSDLPRNGRKSRFDNPDKTTPINSCISLEPFYGSYGDLRKFFNNFIINFKGIKVINDEFGHKTGVCLVQFRDSANKMEALKMDGLELNESVIKIKPISDKVFEEAIDRYNPKMDEMNATDDHSERNRKTKKFLNNEPEIKDFLSLKVEDLPTIVKEQDILHIFSHHPLLSLHMDLKPKGGTVAYVKFSSSEVAKMALKESSQHVIRGKQVTVKPCSDEEFDKINMQQEVILQEETKPIKMVSDCLNVVNLPGKTSDRDISDFFSDIGVIPVKIHLMSNNLGFTGQAYCEFETNEEAARASTKNGIVLGQNTVKVELISRADMEDVLGNSLPHPGTAPGEFLPPGTPLPPIKSEEVPEKLMEDIQEPIEMDIEQEVEQIIPIAAENNLQDQLGFPRATNMGPGEFFDGQGRFDNGHPRFEDRLGRFNDRRPFDEERPFDDRRNFDGNRHFDGPPLRGMFNGSRGHGFGPRGRGFGPRGNEGFDPRGGEGFGPRGGEGFEQRGVEGFGPRDGDRFGPRGGEGFRPRDGEGFRPRVGGFPPREEGFRLRDESFRPRDEGFHPRDEGFRPRDEGFRPRDEGFRPRDESFRSRDEGFRPRDEGFGPRGDFGHRGHGFGPRGHGGPPDKSRFEEKTRHSEPVPDDDDRDDERPGCIVFMDNVPLKAGTDEILKFFAGYNCTENVSRRFNADNTPSAEAKVTFFTPKDAFRAVKELNTKLIWGRPIYLRQE